uniref:Uncharacterized protein n=1 Tax=Anguilla anguilla TaxID=7936 RepID=A0A0E9PCH9_ANGAN
MCIFCNNNWPADSQSKKHFISDHCFSPHFSNFWFTAKKSVLFK